MKLSGVNILKAAAILIGFAFLVPGLIAWGDLTDLTAENPALETAEQVQPTAQEGEQPVLNLKRDIIDAAGDDDLVGEQLLYYYTFFARVDDLRMEYERVYFPDAAFPEVNAKTRGVQNTYAEFDASFVLPQYRFAEDASFNPPCFYLVDPSYASRLSPISEGIWDISQWHEDVSWIKETFPNLYRRYDGDNIFGLASGWSADGLTTSYPDWASGWTAAYGDGAYADEPAGGAVDSDEPVEGDSAGGDSAGGESAEGEFSEVMTLQDQVLKDVRTADQQASIAEVVKKVVNFDDSVLYNSEYRLDPFMCFEAASIFSGNALSEQLALVNYQALSGQFILGVDCDSIPESSQSGEGFRFVGGAYGSGPATEPASELASELASEQAQILSADYSTIQDGEEEDVCYREVERGDRTIEAVPGTISLVGISKPDYFGPLSVVVEFCTIERIIEPALLEVAGYKASSDRYVVVLTWHENQTDGEGGGDGAESEAENSTENITGGRWKVSNKFTHSHFQEIDPDAPADEICQEEMFYGAKGGFLERTREQVLGNKNAYGMLNIGENDIPSDYGISVYNGYQLDYSDYKHIWGNGSFWQYEGVALG